MKTTKAERHAHWREIMKTFEGSDLSQPAFCKANQLSFRKFKYYRYRLRQDVPSNDTAPSRFASITLTPSVSNAVKAQPIILQWPSGIRCEVPIGTDKMTLTTLLEAVQSCG